jgi:hypothetical protein
MGMLKNLVMGKFGSPLPEMDLQMTCHFLFVFRRDKNRQKKTTASNTTRLTMAEAKTAELNAERAAVQRKAFTKWVNSHIGTTLFVAAMS